MTFTYVIIAYVAGVFTPLLVIFSEAYAKSLGKELPSKAEKEEKAEPLIQFVEADPLVDRLQDGTTLNEIIK